MSTIPSRARALASRRRVQALLAEDESLAQRFRQVVQLGRRVRASEYHVTNLCNLRCQGCWFFVHGHEGVSGENRDLERLERFLRLERSSRKVNTALVIGGEPTLFPDRLRVYVETMRNVTISTNGLRRLPLEGFERVAIGITLFGGGRLDDELRGIRPDGRRLRGLFARALANYQDDPRVGFIFAVTEDGVQYVEDTVRKIRSNGNRVTFNYYNRYGSEQRARSGLRMDLLTELLRVQALYPETVMSRPYYIRTMITGQSHWDAFGYDTCPSISIDHPAHRERRRNGNPTLPFFNTYAADLESVKFCCTSGHCHGCRDSQAMNSWLLINGDRFLGDLEQLRTWTELAESYWSQFIWSPLHPLHRISTAGARMNRTGQSGVPANQAERQASAV